MATVKTLPPLGLDPGAVVADKKNMATPAVKQLLNPPTAKARADERPTDSRAERPDAGEPGIVSLTGVAKAYGPIQALDGVALELRAGEVMCLAGENGAGKSTLIKILTGAIKRDSGEYEIDGQDVGNPSPAAGARGGHRRRLPGAQPAPGPVGRREPADGAPARRAAAITRPAELRRQATAMLERVGLDWLDPGTEVGRCRSPPSSSSRSPRSSARRRAC